MRRVAQTLVVATVLFTASCGSEPQPVVLLLHARAQPASAIRMYEELAADLAGSRVELVSLPTSVDGIHTNVGGTIAAVEEYRPLAAIDVLPSRATMAVGQVFAERGIPHVSAAATNRWIPRVVPEIFLMAPSDSVLGDILAGFAADSLGARSAAVFHMYDEYGAGIAQGIRTGLDTRGIALLFRAPHDYYSDMDVLVEAGLLRGTPDVFFVAGYTSDGLALIRELRRRRPGVPIIAGDAVLLDTDALLAALGPCPDALWFGNLSGAFQHRDGVRDRVSPLSGRTVTAFDALVADAIGVVVQAITEGRGRRSGVREYLESLGVQRDAYPGITGPVAFHGSRRHLVRVESLSDVVDGTGAATGQRESPGCDP